MNCRYCVERKRNPKSAKNSTITVALAALKRGFANRLTSSSGSVTRRCHATKAPSARAATAPAVRTGADVQPFEGASMIAQTKATRPTPESAAPVQSIPRAAESRDSGSSRRPASAAIAVSGTLTMKIDPHQKWSSRTPPTTGPSATPRPAVAAQRPIAIVRSRASVKTLIRSESVAGMMNAAPAPMTARATISPSTPPAYAAHAEAPPNTPSPARSVRRRPKRSPSAPARSSRPATASVWAATTHWRSATPASRSRTSVGSATLTIVLSMTMASRLAHSTPSAAHRCLAPVMTRSGARGRRAARAARSCARSRRHPGGGQRRRRADAPLVDEDDDPEGDQPHAPQDVAQEVRGVDHGQVERREHASDHESGGHGAEDLEPAAGVAPPERDDDEHRPRGGEEIAQRFAERGAEDVACGAERIGVAVGRVAGHEDRPAQQADDLHGRRGDPDRHGGPHGSTAREPPDAYGDRREQRRGERQDAEPGADGALVGPERGEHLARRLVEHVGIVEDRTEGGEAHVGQDGREDQQGCSALLAHVSSLLEWLAPAIQATRTLSGWSARWSRASASTSSRSPSRWAPAMATSWRSRVVAAIPRARATRPSPSGANSAAATRIIGSSLVRDASTIAVIAAASPSTSWWISCSRWVGGMERPSRTALTLR